MGLQIRNLTGLLLLAAAMAVMPFHFSSEGLGQHEAFANNAGGNGKGKGQGATHAGTNGGGGSASSAASGKSLSNDDALHASNLGRFNGPLHASAKAWQNASPQSPTGILAGAYAAALNGLLTNTVTPDPNAVNVPTIEQLGAILATVANKDTVPPELVDALHAKMVEVGLLDQALLDQAVTNLALQSADPANPAPTLAQLIADQANLVQATQTSEGLGPIY
jgi:hypothetical protein